MHDASPSYSTQSEKHGELPRNLTKTQVFVSMYYVSRSSVIVCVCVFCSSVYVCCVLKSTIFLRLEYMGPFTKRHTRNGG